MRKPPGTLSLFPILARQQWRRRVRAFRAPGRRVVTIVMVLFGAYIGFTLFTLGAFLPVFVNEIAPESAPRDLVDRYLLSSLVALFFLRFLLQKTPKVLLEPLLLLPVPRWVPVAFFSATSVLSVHNLFPLVFAVPFALRHLAPTDGFGGAVQWIAAVIAALLVSNFLNVYIRTQLNRHEKVFMAGLAAILILSLVDEYLGAAFLGRVSAALFGEMHRPSVLLSLSLAGMIGGTALLAAGGLLDALRREDVSNATVSSGGRLHELAERWDLAGHLIWLELRLMARNRRPRHFLGISLMFSTIYLLFLLASPAVFDGVALGAVIGLFASGGFALNYGQLMFAWDSGYLEGLMARSVRFRVLTRAKTVVLQASCLILFLVSLPVFLWLRPDLVPLHVAFLFYNAGVTVQVVMALATQNRERVDLGRSGGFFNYEGFSAKHWVWFLPTALPPSLILFAFRDQPSLAWTVLAAVGLLGLATTEIWTRRHAARVERTKYAMLAGFAVRS